MKSLFELTTLELLAEWGVWARVPEGERLGYPNSANFATFVGSSAKNPGISLETALVVDRIVKFAGLIEPNYEKVLVARYVGRRTQIQLSRKLHTSRREAVEILHKAEAWFDGYKHSVCDEVMRVEDLSKPMKDAA